MTSNSVKDRWDPRVQSFTARLSCHGSRGWFFSKLELMVCSTTPGPAGKQFLVSKQKQADATAASFWTHSFVPSTGSLSYIHFVPGTSKKKCFQRSTLIRCWRRGLFSARRLEITACLFLAWLINKIIVNFENNKKGSCKITCLVPLFVCLS